MLLPSRMTPALLASIVRLPERSSGSSVERLIVTGESGGNTDGSKEITAGAVASSMACRRVPAPASSELVTTYSMGAGVWGLMGGVATSDTDVAVGEGAAVHPAVIVKRRRLRMKG